MSQLDKKLLNQQINVFLSWGARKGTTSSYYKEWLDLFCTHSLRSDILDVGKEDIDLFLEIVQNRVNTKLQYKQAHNAIHELTRFYMARSRNARTKLERGRPPHISEIQKTQEYRKKGLSYRDISKLMGKELSQLHRWAKYPLEKLLK